MSGMPVAAMTRVRAGGSGMRKYAVTRERIITS